MRHRGKMVCEMWKFKRTLYFVKGGKGWITNILPKKKKKKKLQHKNINKQKDRDAFDLQI